jgi:hypothetical protein
MNEYPYMFSYKTEYLMGNAKQFTHKMDYNYIIRQTEQALVETHYPLSVLLIGDRLPGCYAALGEYFQRYPSLTVWKAQNQEESMLALAQEPQFVIFVGYLKEESIYTLVRQTQQNRNRLQTVLFASEDDCTRQIRQEQKIDFLYDRREPVSGLITLMLQAVKDTYTPSIKSFGA